MKYVCLEGVKGIKTTINIYCFMNKTILDEYFFYSLFMYFIIYSVIYLIYTAFVQLTIDLYAIVWG